MSKEFDVVVIGAGPGGYIAAIRAAQLGKSVACIEKWKNPAGTLKLGGTCLNVGCIPSKALLASSEEFENATKHLGDHGISVSDVKLDITKMLARKEGIVEKMTKGIEFLFRKNKITWLKGHGKFTGKTDAGVQIEVSGEGETETVTAKNVIIATGSKARHLPNIPVDNKIVADNEGALSFDAVPKKLAVIGAGVIGLELGSVWRRLGSDVTVLEALPEFLGACDQALVEGSREAVQEAGSRHSRRREGRRSEGDGQQRVARLYGQGRQRADAGSRPPDRVDRPRAEHRQPRAGSDRPEGGRARLHPRR